MKNPKNQLKLVSISMARIYLTFTLFISIFNFHFKFGILCVIPGEISKGLHSVQLYWCEHCFVYCQSILTKRLEASANKRYAVFRLPVYIIQMKFHSILCLLRFVSFFFFISKNKIEFNESIKGTAKPHNRMKFISII